MDSKDKRKEEEESKKKKTTPKVVLKEERSTKEESKKKAEKEIDPESDKDQRMIQRKKSPKSKGAAKIIGQDKQKDGSDDLQEKAEKLSLSDESKSCSGELPEASLSGNIDDMVEHIYETVLRHNGGDFAKAKKVHLFCMIKGENIPLCLTNEPLSHGNTHAEALLINKLKNMNILKESQSSNVKLVVTVYISNSPCSRNGHDCAMNLGHFLEEYQQVELILYVTHLYKMFRASCERHNHNIDDDFYANTCGLWNLMQHKRCSVKSYDERVWENLLQNEHLKFSEDVRNKLMLEYDKRRDYVNKHGTPDGKNDRTRKEEDKFIKDDLKAIGDQILKQLLETKYPSREYKQTCIVCNITAGENAFKLAKSDQGDKHAEELLLEELEKQGPKDETLTITMFMNDTPCSLAGHDCAGKFVQYIKTAKVKLTLYVTSLCGSKKETCTKKDIKGDIIHPDCSKTNEPAHKKGLASLKQHCTVTSPNRDAWQELFSIMNLSENDKIIKDFWEKYEKQERDGIEKEEEVIKTYLDKL